MWTSKVLAGIAQVSTLTALRLPYIPDSWIEDLDSLGRQNLFPRLEALYASLSGFGFEKIFPYIESTCIDLEISLVGKSTQALGIAAQAAFLTRLEINFDDENVIRARDLMMLAENCRNLRNIMLPRKYNETLSETESLTDDTMEYVASRLPDLEELCLHLKDSPLTAASLVSLGTHCKRLDFCQISAVVDFNQLVQSTQSVLFPTLKTLIFFPPEMNRHHYYDVPGIAKLLIERAPKLKDVEFTKRYVHSGDLDLQRGIRHAR